MKIKVKEWLYEQICDKASNYNIFIDVTDESRKPESRLITADAEGYIEVIAEEKIDESEKAIKVRLSSGNVDGSVKGWTCWLAKSQIKY